MQVKFRDKFNKDIQSITKKKVLNAIINVIENVENANKINDIHNIKKMKGHKCAYRIRIGYYRIGLFFENNSIEFSRILHRKDIYKRFP